MIEHLTQFMDVPPLYVGLISAGKNACCLAALSKVALYCSDDDVRNM